MAGNKMLVSMALLVVGASAHPAAQAVVGSTAYHKMLVAKGLPTPYPGYDPCAPQTTTPGTTVTTTVATTVTTTPAVTVTVTKKEPCSTVTTTPGVTVTVTKKEPCSTVTTTPGTTATTTPPGPICESFTCEAGYDPQHEYMFCAGRVCTRKQCCKFDPCHPVNLKAVVPPPVPTPSPSTPTVVPVTGPICASFTCEAGYDPNQFQDLPCAGGVCTRKQCCVFDPCHPVNLMSTLTPTVVPVTPFNPCAPNVAAPRLFDAKEKMLGAGAASSMPSKKEVSAVPAWSLPLLGMIAMFSLVAFFARRARRSMTSMRQIPVVEPVDLEDSDEALLDHDAALE